MLPAKWWESPQVLITIIFFCGCLTLITLACIMHGLLK